jgi:hypothetical protein
MRIRAHFSLGLVALTAPAFFLFAPLIFGQSNGGAGTFGGSRSITAPSGDTVNLGGSIGSPPSGNIGNPPNGNIGPPPGNVGPPPGCHGALENRPLRGASKPASGL